jgi:hypothetical protein
MHRNKGYYINLIRVISLFYTVANHSGELIAAFCELVKFKALNRVRENSLIKEWRYAGITADGAVNAVSFGELFNAFIAGDFIELNQLRAVGTSFRIKHRDKKA